MSGVLDTRYAHARLKKPHLKFRYQERALVAVETIRRYLPNGPWNVVDFGAAEGLTLVEIARLLGQGAYTGIEYDAGLIAAAPSLPAHITLRQGDIQSSLDIADASADVVTALAVLEHLSNPHAALVQAARILKPGGLFIATAPNPFWDRMADVFGLSAFAGEHHEIQLDKKIFQALLNGTSLEFADFFPFMWVPIGFLPYLGIPFPPATAWSIDRMVARAGILNWSFVNQCFVARKRL